MRLPPDCAVSMFRLAGSHSGHCRVTAAGHLPGPLTNTTGRQTNATPPHAPRRHPPPSRAPGVHEPAIVCAVGPDGRRPGRHVEPLGSRGIQYGVRCPADRQGRVPPRCSGRGPPVAAEEAIGYGVSASARRRGRSNDNNNETNSTVSR